MMTTFEKIQFELNKRNMSGNELAKACHFSSGLYSQWKSGLQKPSADKVVAIADFLGCSVDYLLGRDESLVIRASEDEWHAILDQMSDESRNQLEDYVDFLLWKQDRDVSASK